MGSPANRHRSIIVIAAAVLSVVAPLWLYRAFVGRPRVVRKPRLMAPRGDLADIGKATIREVETAPPSVV